MRIKHPETEMHKGDLTPMIDMTFQLIAFFMVLINFTQSETDERVQLPESTLAKPPEEALEFPITLQLTRQGSVIIGGTEVLSIQGLRPYLLNEASVLQQKDQQLSAATVIIRAHKDAQTGKVQDLIKICQENGFERFALRAKEDVGN
ncbi:MAG: biopolymer transporter ExbD [Planctomycetaceae bacterium]|nr:biopolymer transporter ExbD [Planctomycetaceae bacterium]